MKQKILGFLAAAMVASVGMVAATPVMTENAMAAGTTRSCGVDGFLGFRPWYYNLCVSGDPDSKIKEPTTEDEMKTFAWAIILNILMDLLVGAGYASMIFIIYGGYQFMMSQGDPGRTASGKKTIQSAIIGMIICLSASVIVNTGIVALSINNTGGNDITQIGNSTQFKQDNIQNAFTWAYTVAGLVAVGMIINGGVKYMMAAGDPGKARAATQSIIYAVIGLIVVLMAAAITIMVTKTVSGTVF